MPKFSVVVPVYSAEKYIGECIESVLSQSLSDFELILVDDGSPDASGRICDSYALRDSRIKVIHQPNNGHITARMNGVKHAEGEYILFLDSDDYWLNGLLEKLDEKLALYGSDVLIFRLHHGEKNCCDFFGGERADITKEEYFARNLAETGLNSLVIKAFARKLFKNVDISAFSTFRNSEDLVLSTMLISAAERISYIPDVLYYYRLNKASITNNINENALDEFIASREYLWRELERYGLNNEANETILCTVFMRRAADLILQVSTSKMKTKEKLAFYRRIDSMPFFGIAEKKADISALGAAKRLRLRLFCSGKYRTLLFSDKLRNLLR